jgi:tRNA modification GTPase
VLIDQGARLATQGEFTLRAFLNGRIDLSQAEAVNDLIHSENEMSRDIALGQMKGGFKDQISALRQQLIKFASLVELELDFSEEDVEFADRSQLEDLILSTVKVLTGLIQSFEFGNVVRNGVPTAIVGRPNAGKSTLLNALLNEERAIVSQIEGTTRDTIEETMTLNGITFRFIDTAGIRQGEDEIEVIGIEKTFEKIREAKLVVYLFDAAIMDSEELQKDIDDLAIDQQHLIIVANKTDKEGAENWAKDFDAYNTIGISAKEKAQIEDLQKQLVDLVLSEQIDTSATIITNSRHYQELSEAKNALEDVLNAMHAGLTGDLLAIDIRKSLHALGNITGEISTDDLLDSIFRDFCIGK